MTGQDHPRVFLPPPLIFGGLLALGLLWDSAPATLGIVPVVGGVLAAAGLLLIGVALGLFRMNKTRPEPWQPSSVLVRRGIYRRTRNPMYLGMAAVSLGLAMVFASLPAAILTAVATLLIDRFVVRREEEYLKRRFGGDYLDYCGQVRRWL